MEALSFGYVRPATALIAAALAGGVSTAHAQAGAQPIDLGRFNIPQLTTDPPATIRAQLTFQVLMSFSHSEWDAARSLTPAYRDIVIRTAYGYAAYTARNGGEASPDRLAHLIAARIGDASALPVPVFITFPNFQEVRPPSTDGALRVSR